jgi:hypothetical protein
MKKKIEFEWNYNLDEAPESEKVLISFVNQYKTAEVAIAHLWYGRWINAHGGILNVKPYAFAGLPKPAPLPKTKKDEN